MAEFASADSDSVTRDSPAQPLYFGAGARTLFGWLHWPVPGAAAAMGVVICKPFGFEAVSSHQSMRAFAEAAAAQGFPTLRFDYAGTGDSTDLDPGANQLVAWTGDVVAAARELQRRSGVTRVALLGFRLGALLATLAASELDMVTALAVVAPILSGKRYLRELRTTELAAAQRMALETSGGVSTAAPVSADAPFEASGFPLSAATMTSLSEINLTSSSAPPVADLLVLDRADLPTARPWCDPISALGARVRYQTLTGFIEMMMRGPERTVVPTAMIAAVGDWLRSLPVAPGAALGDRTPGAPLKVPAGTETLTERPVLFGSGPFRFGIVTEPPSREVRRRGVILVNSGADYHVGPRRMHVSLARRWSRHGYVVLRMDLTGLGDSGKGPGRPGNEPFPPEAVEDIRAALELIRDRYSLRDITVGGMCSGAYHSLRAALEGLPVNRILLINPLNFFQEEALQPEEVQTWEIVQSPSAYRGHVLSVRFWHRLLRGNINFRRALKICWGGLLLGLQTKLRDIARRLHIPVPRDLARDLAHIAARGIRIVFVFSRGDPGIGLLELHSGSSLEQLGERYRVRIVDGADHNLTRSGPRAKLEDVLSEELFARNC